MKILFIRHLKTMSNLERRYVGTLDESLFEPENQPLPKGLPHVEKLYVSPMKRCIETANILYPGVDYCSEPGLKEMNFGIFEGKTYEDLMDDNRYIDFINGKDQVPEGDSISEFKGRCVAAFEKLVKEAASENETIGIICHGGVIMAIMEAYDIGNKGFYDYQVKNGGGFLTSYHEVEGRGRLEILQEIGVVN